MLLKLTVLLLAGIVLTSYSSSQRIRVRRQNMKVRINATEDTIVLKFVRPSPDVKLEGYILGYGGSMFSKQFIQLPESGEPYEAEMDAEPKYLVAVQPIPTNNIKKHCTGHVDLEKPLHLVIGSVTPTTVLLSWGTLLTTPFERNIMNDCLEDGNENIGKVFGKVDLSQPEHYTVRYREPNRKWNYQTCPTSDTVIDNLKPNTQYEFGVQSNKEDQSGEWSKPVTHNTNTTAKSFEIQYKPKVLTAKPEKPVMAGPHVVFPPRPVIHNRNKTKLTTVIRRVSYPGISRPPSVSYSNRQPGVPPPQRPISRQRPELPQGSANTVINVSSKPKDTLAVLPQTLPVKTSPTSAAPLPHYSHNIGKGLSWTPPKLTNTSQGSRNPSGKIIVRNSTSSVVPVLQSPAPILKPKRKPTNPAAGILLPPSNTRRKILLPRPANSSKTHLTPRVNGERHSGHPYSKPMWPRLRKGFPAERPKAPDGKKPNLVGKPGAKDKPGDFKHTDAGSIVKPKHFPVTAKPVKEQKRTTTTAPVYNAGQVDVMDNSSILSPLPASDVDAMGKKRYIAPHVKYWQGKKPSEPCSITSSLSNFPEEDWGELNVTAPPRLPPSNLTVLSVEGCPSFVILDWEKTDNETTEYEVTTTTDGPDGNEVSIHTTNQTHTAVENLKPDSSYEFTVKPKNELGEGPATEPVSFVTESADPQVSDNLSGKNAIWTQYPFTPDTFSECNGKQYVKRTWYRKFVGIQLCNSLRYKIYLSDSLSGKFYNIGDQTGYGEDHCQFVDSFLDGKTGNRVYADQLPPRAGYYRAVRQQPVNFGDIGGNSHITYVTWYECGVPIPGKW